MGGKYQNSLVILISLLHTTTGAVKKCIPGVHLVATPLHVITKEYTVSSAPVIYFDVYDFFSLEIICFQLNAVLCILFNLYLYKSYIKCVFITY